MNWLTETINFLFLSAVDPILYVTRLDQRIYWLYLFVALLFAAWIFVHMGGPAENVKTESGLRRLKDFGKFCFPGKVYGHKSAKIDYLFFIVNRIAFPWFNAPRYWDEHVLALREQAALMEEEPLVWREC